MSLRVTASLLLSALLLTGAIAVAQAPPPPTTSLYLIPYGPPVTLEMAKKAAAAAQAEAQKNGWFMTIAVVDPGGTLIYYERMDNSETAASTLAIEKARSSVLYKRPTKVFQDGLAAGGMGLRILGLTGGSVIEGGIPLNVNGKIIGAIGVSGDASEHDAQCATAGANALKQP